MTWTIERNRALREMLASGLPEEEIAERLGCNIKNLRRKLAARTKYDVEDAEEIYSLWRSGLNYIQIGERKGISKNSVRVVLKRIGALDDPENAHLRTGGPASKLTEDRAQQLRDLISKGWSIMRIAERLGVSRPTIWRWIGKLGIAVERKKGDWTDSDDAILREKLNDGLSFSEIADIIGVTRGAVAGRAHRLGLRSKSDPRKKLAGLRRYAIGQRPAKKPSVSDKKNIVVDIGEDDLTGAVIFTALTSRNQCRWPVHGSGMNMLCCARQVDGQSPYCHRHRLRSRRMPGESTRRPKFIVTSVRGGAWR